MSHNKAVEEQARRIFLYVINLQTKKNRLLAKPVLILLSLHTESLYGNQSSEEESVWSDPSSSTGPRPSMPSAR